MPKLIAEYWENCVLAVLSFNVEFTGYRVAQVIGYDSHVYEILSRLETIGLVERCRRNDSDEYWATKKGFLVLKGRLLETGDLGLLTNIGQKLSNYLKEDIA